MPETPVKMLLLPISDAMPEPTVIPCQKYSEITGCYTDLTEAESEQWGIYRKLLPKFLRLSMLPKKTAIPNTEIRHG